MSLKHKPRILLVRPRRGSGPALFARMATEPLELEYLAAAATEEGCSHMIFDREVMSETLEQVLDEFSPDVVGITGYFVARDEILAIAATAKAMLPSTVVIVGGVHAEINCADFYDTSVDLVVHAGGVNTFRQIICAAKSKSDITDIPGTCHKGASGEWNKIEAADTAPCFKLRPDRSHFHQYRDRFNYLHHGPTAIVKTAFGCPFECTFCYCRLLNDGKYHARDAADIVDEIANIDCETVWIVDDSFLVDLYRVRKIAKLLDEQQVRKRLIIYSRADSIAHHPEIIPTLQSMGVVNVIVGLEAADDDTLKDYKKQVAELDNRACVQMLRDAEIECTGLFIMEPDASSADFARLNLWIDQSGLKLWTVSVYSPFPGTAAYEENVDQLTTHDCRKWDLLHLVMKPSKMSRFAFYFHMLWIHIRTLFKNPSLLRHILGIGPQPAGDTSL